MSAWIVSRAHIDALVDVALHGPTDAESPWSPVNWTPDLLGRTLWLENLASVAHRYPDDRSGERAGCDDTMTDEAIAAYTAALPARHLTTVEALKAIRCLVYQSCEHPEWERSEAKRFCDRLTLMLIGVLPGYDEAPWGIA